MINYWKLKYGTVIESSFHDMDHAKLEELWLCKDYLAFFFQKNRMLTYVLKKKLQSLAVTVMRNLKSGKHLTVCVSWKWCSKKCQFIVIVLWRNWVWKELLSDVHLCPLLCLHFLWVRAGYIIDSCFVVGIFFS